MFELILILVKNIISYSTEQIIIYLANAMSEKYTTGDKSGSSLKALSQYIKNAIELAK